LTSLYSPFRGVQASAGGHHFALELEGQFHRRELWATQRSQRVVGVHPRAAVSKEAVSKEAVSKEAVSKEAVSKEAVSKEAASTAAAVSRAVVRRNKNSAVRRRSELHAALNVRAHP
jgi:hypothetical protein